jgi:DNA-directed RNA polymerase beta' subunit
MSNKSNLKPHTNPSRIIGIQFSMLSPEEIRKNSVAEITKRDTYINNKPVIGGMFDPRMGVLEPGLICPTDGLTYIDTPGYFGHIELGRPVFFIQHIKDIMKVCRCVCFKCSKLKINKAQHTHALNMTPMDRWDYVSNIAVDVKRCGDSTDDGCGCLQPDKIKLEGMATIIAVWSNVKTDTRVKGEKVTMKMTPEIVLKIFKRISDEDVSFMGFSPIWSRPDWMICQVLPVAPPAVRPSVKHDAQQRSEDDLTHIYSNIIKTNSDLVAKINDNAQPNVIEGLTTVLQYFVAMIVNNKVKGAMPMAQRSGRPLQCIMGRINSKNGRIRGNLMGKRVDFSARSVITGDPNLSIRQLGVPMKIAKNITKPVTVNKRNMDFLLRLIQNGPDKYPGAKILERKNGEQISLRYVDRDSIRLEPGDVVHRHMMNGDAVLFNRQPSLHRMSMMCHIVQIMKVGDTFRMNVGDTKPYNADFDGDEMNMHMPQNVIAETELRHLAAIPYQIVSPANNAPIIGIYQDSMLGSYRFTRKRIDFTARDAMNLLMMYPEVDVTSLFANGRETVSNFDILSQVMPPITMLYKTDAFGDTEDYSTSNNVLEIRSGKYVRGQMDKSVLGKSTKGIIHRAFNDFGNRHASDFIDNLQNIITEYMKSSSFSVGISDLIADANTNSQIVQVINKQKGEVNTIINQVHMGIFENNTSASNQNEFEQRVNNVLNDAMNETGKISRKSLSKENRFSIIVNSGSKGSLLNISQMISCLGQQNVDGKRIPYGFDSRTLPHFSKFDDSPNARGFVENSYISGLSAPELFFHAMGGRIGLIDTAVKTSQTGYIQRRLIKGLEDLKVEYDMTVRNSKGKIIQFMYGDDGFDTTRVENQVIPLVAMSIEDIYMHYDILGVADVTSGLLSGLYTKGTISRLKKQKDGATAMSKKYIDLMIQSRNNMVESMFKNRDDNGVRIPVSFQSIIQNTQGNAGLNANSVVDITPLEAYQLIEEYYKKLERIVYVPPTELFKVMYYYYLSPRDLLMTKRFHRAALVILLETVILKYKQAIVHPGEMVGVIAGQSIGEPTTQLTLNSVTYETEILVRNAKGEIQCVQIGDFTRDGIKSSPKIEYMSEKDTTYAELLDYYEVPSATETGETVWRRIEAVTKHPVINEDGTNTMIKVTTKGNREVIATKAKSFLQLIDGKIQGVHGKDLKVGEYLPVSKKALDFTPVHELDLRELLPPTEYIYGTEIEKARSVVDQYQWWSKHANKTFVVPYSRSDSLYCALRGNKRSKHPVEYKSGCVYTTTNSICNYEVPESIPLDYEFGYLIGAYCAEGCMTKHQISISNNDTEYLKPIQEWCARYNITTKIYTQKDKNQEGWTSQDIRLYNTVLCRILDKLCGKLSHNKFVSQKIMFSNPECIRGFLDAYIGGDGSVGLGKNGGGQDITISSVSHRMLTSVQVMLKNVGVLAKMNKPALQTSNNRGSQNIKQIYVLRIANNQAKHLASILHMRIAEKQRRCEQILSSKQTRYEYCKSDLILPNMIDGVTYMEPRDGRCIDLEFDQIVSIEEVPNTTDYAYDLTVEDTRTFDCMNGVAVNDTFHHSGTSSKSNVTRGVPRIEEILRLTKNPKNPSLTVFLKSMDEGNQERANTLANMLEHTRLHDVVSSVEICFDPIDAQTYIREDDVLMTQFLEFERLVKECNEEPGVNEPTENEAPKSKWIIRMELDPEILLDKNITMDDVNFAIKHSSYGNDIHCVYADFNSDKLIFRIRLNSSVFKKGKQRGVAETLDQSDEIYLLRNFQDNLLNNIVLRGINGIQNVLPRKVQNMVTKDDGKYVRKDTWVLDTTGSNFLDALGVDYIDYRRTYSNDIKEVFDVLGIEAARQVVHNELVEVMEFSGVYINYHHTSLLCDRMTSNRHMVSIFRTGIIEDNIGPVAKATFEVHTEVLLDAARHADFDHMRGVSANVMCGQNGYYGTSAFQLVLDMKEMEQLEDEIAETKNTSDAIDDMFGSVKQDSELCPRRKIEIDNNISTIRREKTAHCDDDYNMGF